MPGGPLVCYDVDSGSDSESGTEDVKPEIEMVEYSSERVVYMLLEEIMDNVFNGIRDFSDMYIKEEPLDDESIAVEDDVINYNVKVEIESESEEEEEGAVSLFGPGASDYEDDEVSCLSKPLRTKNEITLSDLPPVKDLDISINEAEAVKIGVITSCVDELVVIESLPNNPAIDIDSVLFLDSGKRALGHVFDVIGPVARPFYCVRFNSVKHITEKNIAPGMDVFYAPKSEYTSFVFLEQLMKLKISDASWCNDEEPPPQFLDYSDDEEERLAKKEVVITKMIRAGASQEQINAKREKMKNTRKRRINENTNLAQEDNGTNMHYNSQRHDNGLYNHAMNPFYRQERRYNPREMGPIRWDSVRPTGGNFNQYQATASNQHGGYNYPPAHSTYSYGGQNNLLMNMNVPPPPPPSNGWQRSQPPPPSNDWQRAQPPPPSNGWQRSQPPPPPPPFGPGSSFGYQTSQGTAQSTNYQNRRRQEQFANNWWNSQ